MEIIVYLPFFITLAALVFRSPEKVFLSWYLPILLMLPQIFTLHINRVPDVTFNQTAIIPLFIAGFIERIHRWKWSLTDFLLIIFFAEMSYSEYITEGLGSTAQMMTNTLTNMIFPYILAKILIHPPGYTIPFAKAIVVIMYINVILCVYEARFTVNPYIQFFQHLFPSQGYEWPTLTRYGLVRLAGPFVQPILFAVACSIAFFFNLWIARCGYWGKHYRYIPDLPITKGWLFGSILFLGLLHTFSRGPLLSLALGFLFIGIGYSKRPWPSFITRGILFGVASLLISLVYDFYAEIGTGLASSDEAMTLAYRTELIHKYSEITWERPWFGWGVNSWPKVASTVSIDNQYLWLTLKHGYIATGIFILIATNIALSLIKRGFALPLNYTRERTLNFTFFGMYLSIVFAFATVYMGMQLESLFFLLTGWIEGYVHTPPQENQSWDKITAGPQKNLRGAK